MHRKTKRRVKLQDSETLTRYWNSSGWPVGTSVDEGRKQSVAYDAATGRIAESDGFRWEYRRHKPQVSIDLSQ